MVTFFNSISSFIFNSISYIASSTIGMFLIMLLIIGSLFSLVYRMAKGGY